VTITDRAATGGFDAGATGSFFWAVTMFAVGGARHSPSSTSCAAKEEDK